MKKVSKVQFISSRNNNNTALRKSAPMSLKSLAESKNPTKMTFEMIKKFMNKKNENGL
jgi:hypothetical protein